MSQYDERDKIMNELFKFYEMTVRNERGEHGYIVIWLGNLDFLKIFMAVVIVFLAGIALPLIWG
jgi:hypothetical protein